MSLTPKSQAALSVVFILAMAGSLSITAQTPNENTSTSTDISVPSTIKPKNLGYKLPWDRSVENPTRDKSSRDKSSEVSSDPDNSNSAPVMNLAAGTSSTAKATTSWKTAPRAPQAGDSDSWQFQFSPYFWLAGLHGTGGVGNRTVNVEESFSDVFHVLNFAFMATFEARKDKFISLTDIEYVSISDEKATPGPLFSTVDAGFKTFIFDQEVGYRLYHNTDNGASVDVLGGVRVWHVSMDFESVPESCRQYG